MTITIKGIEHLTAKLTALSGMGEVKSAIQKAGYHVKGKIATYPSGGQHRPQPFTSAKQRRGFFYHLKKGDIQVPYRRGMSPGSKAMGRKWTVKATDGGLTATVGNNVDYGPLVQGPNSQTRYHQKTGWKTTTQVMDDERDTVQKYVQEAVRKVLNS
jgi:hypothetical protein